VFLSVFRRALESLPLSLSLSLSKKRTSNRDQKNYTNTDIMKLDLSSLPSARGLADAVAAIAPLHFAAGAVLVFGAGRMIPDYTASYKDW
jgi:hypothetical protein